jgi:hypothetical protein
MQIRLEYFIYCGKCVSRFFRVIGPRMELNIACTRQAYLEPGVTCINPLGKVFDLDDKLQTFMALHAGRDDAIMENAKYFSNLCCGRNH